MAKTPKSSKSVSSKSGIPTKGKPVPKKVKKTTRKTSDQKNKKIKPPPAPEFNRTDIPSSTIKEKSDTTEEKIRRVGDKLSEAADKGVDVLREVFGKVRDFSIDATELTKLKVEIHRLKGDRERMLTVMGEKLWEMRDSDKIKGIYPIFTQDFKKIEELSLEIKKKEKLASKISL